MNAVDVERLVRMRHSPVRNYVIPGLTSWLIGGEPGGGGCVRLFECSREHQEAIAPHSHRFEFQCLVVSGWVNNVLWVEHPDGDEYQKVVRRYGGSPGVYVEADGASARYVYKASTHRSGEWYGMTADQIHSIYFGRDTKVLFFEGPSVVAESITLAPIVDGEVIRNYKVEPWMFRRTP